MFDATSPWVPLTNLVSSINDFLEILININNGHARNIENINQHANISWSQYVNVYTINLWWYVHVLDKRVHNIYKNCTRCLCIYIYIYIGHMGHGHITNFFFKLPPFVLRSASKHPQTKTNTPRQIRMYQLLRLRLDSIVNSYIVWQNILRLRPKNNENIIQRMSHRKLLHITFLHQAISGEPLMDFGANFSSRFQHNLYKIP